MMRFELGLFDPPEMVPFTRINSSVVDSLDHRALALEAAVKGAVLLRNRPVVANTDDRSLNVDSGSGAAVDIAAPSPPPPLLPLDPTRLKRVAVIGPNADNPNSLLSNYNGCLPTSKGGQSPCHLVTPLMGLQTALPGAIVGYAQGCRLSGGNTSGIDAAVQLAHDSDVAVLVLGLTSRGLNEGERLEDEALDRANLTLPGHQLELALRVLAARPQRTVIVLMSGGLVSEPLLVGAAPALVQLFYPGEEGGTALARLLLGQEAFSGHLPVTMVANASQLPPYLVQDMAAGPGRTYRYLKEEPLYPFGYGLGYATFRYSTVTLTPSILYENSTAGNLTVWFTVHNEGAIVSAMVSTSISTAAQVSGLPFMPICMYECRREYVVVGYKMLLLTSGMLHPPCLWVSPCHLFMPPVYATSCLPFVNVTTNRPNICRRAADFLLAVRVASQQYVRGKPVDPGPGSESVLPCASSCHG